MHLAKEPEKIGGSLMDALSRMGIAERLHKQQAVTRWKEAVGEVIAAQTEALKIDGDTLVVKVFQAAWRQELIFLKDELLAKLENEIGKDLIKDIRFV